MGVFSDIVETIGGAFGFSAPNLPAPPSLPAPPAAPDLGPSLRLQVKSAKQQTEIAHGQLGLSKRQSKIAQEYYDHWADQIRPVMTRLLDDVKKGIDPNVFEARARNAVFQGLTPLERETRVALSMRGIDASSPAAVSAGQDVAGSVAADAAGAQIGERNRLDAVNMGRRFHAVGLGAAIPHEAVQGFGQASGLMGAAGQGVANATTGLANAYAQRAQNQSQLANNAYNLQVNQLLGDHKLATQEAMNQQSAQNSMFQAGGTLLGMKLFARCIAEGVVMDVPGGGGVFIQQVDVGDKVVGIDGQPATVLIKQSYLEKTVSQGGRPFLRIRLHDGYEIVCCEWHVIDDTPAGELGPGSKVGDKMVSEVTPVVGVRKSYDLITSGPDQGYMIGGVPVASMIEKMAETAAKAREVIHG